MHITKIAVVLTTFCEVLLAGYMGGICGGDAVATRCACKRIKGSIKQNDGWISCKWVQSESKGCGSWGGACTNCNSFSSYCGNE